MDSRKEDYKPKNPAHPPSVSCTSWPDPIILTHSKQGGHALGLLRVSIMGPLGASGSEWHRLWMFVILFNLCALPSARLPACLVCRPVTFIQPQRRKDGVLPGKAGEGGMERKRERENREGEVREERKRWKGKSRQYYNRAKKGKEKGGDRRRGEK